VMIEAAKAVGGRWITQTNPKYRFRRIQGQRPSDRPNGAGAHGWVPRSIGHEHAIVLYIRRIRLQVIVMGHDHQTHVL